ncbi:MAG TPA: gamma-glutamylcyclotransferase family protein [Urbifossiella sp.]|jgi:cation transport regulator ChaC|nr:gamma-glutamylcyclotransferase family protein [Urbifossiella sp.]
MWYFAYGSNLCTAQMAVRTGLRWAGADRPRRVYLPGYRLAFDMSDGGGRAFANIVRPGSGVLGVLYRCDPQALGSLDGFEVGYQRTRVEVRDEAGTAHEAIAYIARPGHTTVTDRPTTEYLRRIVLGARGHGLPEPYIRSIAAASGLSGELEAGEDQCENALG